MTAPIVRAPREGEAAAVERDEFDTAFRDRLAVDVGVTYHDEVTC